MMLAIELSTRMGSIALCNSAGIIAQHAWDDPAARHAALWPTLDALVKKVPLDWTTLRGLAVGRGPGSFSGVRAAITAARVLALPGNHPVMAISSGAAVAHTWLEAHPTAQEPLIVAGDARRGAIWFSLFRRHDDGVQQVEAWALAAAADFPAVVPENARIITSDRARLRAALGTQADAVQMDPEDHFPSASAIAHLARARFARGLASEPLEPLYLHPAIAV